MDSRRTFILGAGGAFASHLSSGQALSANDKVRVAVLGVNGRGRDHIGGIMPLPDAEVVMLCDPDQSLLDKRSAEFEKAYGKKPAVTQDLRRVFDNKEIDAVTVATPNHWHALAAIWACQAGKDGYVEKPGAHNVYEGRKLVEAARKYQHRTARCSEGCHRTARCSEAVTEPRASASLDGPAAHWK
jgi:hypothetical protein